MTLEPAFTPAQERFRDDLRELFTSEPVRREIARLAELSPAREVGFVEVHRTLGARGALAPHWPVDLGGLGRSMVELGILAEEMVAHGIPDIAHVLTVTVVGTVLLHHGTPQQRAAHLPAMAAGVRVAAVLLSEPEAGSDLGSLQTRAEPDGAGWRLYGRKLYSQKSQLADVALCAARTNPAAMKYAGVSLFLIPLRTPAITVRTVPNLGDEQFCEVTLNGLLVGPDDLVGELDGGWAVLGDALSLERTGLDFSARARRWLDPQLTRLDPGDGAVDPLLLDRLVDLDARVQAGRLLAWRAVAQLGRKRVDQPVVAGGKWFNSELAVQVTHAGLQAYGTAATRSAWDRRTPAGGLLARAYREAPGLTLASGTSEVMLRMIASGLLEGGTAVAGEMAGATGEVAPAPAELAMLTPTRARAAVRWELRDIFHPDLLSDLRRLGRRRPGADAPPEDAELTVQDQVWKTLVEWGALAPDRDLPSQVALAELLGEAAYQSPLLDSMAAVDLLRLAGREPPAAVPVALAARADSWSPLGTPGPLRCVAGEYRIVREAVPFAASGQLLVVGEDGGGTLHYLLLPPGDARVRLEREDELGDGERYRVSLATSRLDGELDRRHWRRVLAGTRVRQSGYLVGLAAATLQLALAYVTKREQFGGPVARQQSVAARLAARWVEVEAARQLCFGAAGELAVGEEFGDVTAGQALALAGQVALAVATDSLHYHGAYGLTAECDAQLLYRQVAVESVRLGHAGAVRHEIGPRFAQRVASDRQRPGAYSPVRKI